MSEWNASEGTAGNSVSMLPKLLALHTLRLLHKILATRIRFRETKLRKVLHALAFGHYGDSL